MTTTETIDIKGSTGARLSGVLHLPDAEPLGSLLLAHCFTCSKDLHTSTRLATGLAQAGYAVLRFDLTGLGDSDGDFAQTTLSHDVRDLVAAATELIRRGYGPCGLIGHSLGGAAALLAAKRLKTVRSVVVLGTPFDATHVRHLITAEEDTIERDGQAEVSIGGRPFTISREFLVDLERHSGPEHISELDRPLLVVHAVDDTVVDISEGERIFAAARQPKAFHPLLDTDHLVTDRDAAQHLQEVVARWFDQTLGPRQAG